LVAVGLTVVVVASLTGCVDPSLELTPQDSLIAKCATVSRIPVETLSASTFPACDIVGSELVFPDGHSMKVEDQGVTAAESGFLHQPGTTYGIINAGRYGVVATFQKTDGVTPGPLEWFGNPAAIAVYRKFAGYTPFA